MRARFKFSDSFKLIKNIKTTGTITPSSKNLVRRLLAPIDFERAGCIVELGPGSGVVTRSLLKRMHKDCVLVCLEVNNDFVNQLTRVNDPRLHVYNACASSIRQILNELGFEKVDYVVAVDTDSLYVVLDTLVEQSGIDSSDTNKVISFLDKVATDILEPVSYTHLTLPTKRIV